VIFQVWGSHVKVTVDVRQLLISLVTLCISLSLFVPLFGIGFVTSTSIGWDLSNDVSGSMYAAY